MELWIRSQNKCKLRKIDIINYSYEAEKHIVDCNGYPMGTYKSKERCLEIIDEIQELLKLGNPENAFYHIHNAEMSYDDILTLFERVRRDKAIVTSDATFDVVTPSVITSEMPEE